MIKVTEHSFRVAERLQWKLNSLKEVRENPRSMLSTIKSRIFTKDISEEERRNKEEKKQE